MASVSSWVTWQWLATLRSSQTCAFNCNCGCCGVTSLKVYQVCYSYRTIISGHVEVWPKLITGDDLHFI